MFEDLTDKIELRIHKDEFAKTLDEVDKNIVLVDKKLQEKLNTTNTNM